MMSSFEWADKWYWITCGFMAIAAFLSGRALWLEHEREKEVKEKAATDTDKGAPNVVGLPVFVYVSLWGTLITTAGGIVAVSRSSYKEFEKDKEERQQFAENVTRLETITTDLMKVQERLNGVSSDLAVTTQQASIAADNTRQAAYPIDGAILTVRLEIPRPKELNGLSYEEIKEGLHGFKEAGGSQVKYGGPIEPTIFSVNPCPSGKTDTDMEQVVRRSLCAYSVGLSFVSEDKGSLFYFDRLIDVRGTYLVGVHFYEESMIATYIFPVQWSTDSLGTLAVRSLYALNGLEPRLSVRHQYWYADRETANKVKIERATIEFQGHRYFHMENGQEQRETAGVVNIYPRIEDIAGRVVHYNPDYF